jgi:hypothetical protein
MSRRSQITSSQRIDLIQRRRTRDLPMYSESPIALNVHRLPGGGSGGGTEGEAPVIIDMSWLSPDIGWMDPMRSWLS